MAFYELEKSSASFEKNVIDGSGLVNFNFPMHFHSSFELLFVMEGTIEVVIERSVYYPVEGNIVLIPPNKAHSYRTEKFSVVSVGIFNTDYLSEIREEMKTGIFRNPVIENGKELFDELVSNQNNHFIYRSVLYRIADAYSKNEIIQQENEKKNIGFAHDLYEYFQQHYKEPLNEKLVAKAMGYHPRYLSYLIQRDFGACFRLVLNECRVRQACKLLREENISITEAYLAVGFDSQCTFNRNFKEIMGVTPQKYKQGYRIGKKVHS